MQEKIVTITFTARFTNPYSPEQVYDATNPDVARRLATVLERNAKSLRLEVDTRSGVFHPDFFREPINFDIIVREDKDTAEAQDMPFQTDGKIVIPRQDDHGWLRRWLVRFAVHLLNQLR